MSVASVKGILAFHKLDRKVFDRVVTHGRNHALARNIVSLWMWLELIGIGIVVHIKDCVSEMAVNRFIVEAEAILDVLRPNSAPPAADSAIPSTASLTTEPLDLGFFFFNSEVVVRGMTQILDGVGRIIFDDGLKTLLEVYEEAVRYSEEARRRGIECQVPQAPSQLTRAYESRPVLSPEDYRALFITFSKGYPLKREEIEEYFTQKWGDCVEKVMIERTSTNSPPMYGRLVFRSESFIGLALNGENLVKFVIQGKQMWVRQYFPRVG